MICIIRIHGRVGLNEKVKNTLKRLRLGKKYSCIVIEPTKEIMGMVRRVENQVAYGKISEDVYKKLVEKRKTKIKNFFRLHPPRGGVKSTKLHFPKGILGDNKDLNKLVEKML